MYMKEIPLALIVRHMRAGRGSAPPGCKAGQQACGPVESCTSLLELPSEALQLILEFLTTRDLGCFAATCKSYWSSRAMPTGTSPVEEILRKRAYTYTVNQRAIGQLPPHKDSWVSHLLWREFLMRSQDEKTTASSGVPGGQVLSRRSSKWQRRGAVTFTSPSEFRRNVCFGDRC
jgi:hypothetical protein